MATGVRRSALPLLWLAVSGVLCRGQSLRDDFYSEVRDLLDRRFSQELQREDTQAGARRPVQATGWPRSLPGLGQVSGVSVDPRGNPVIFHRAGRVWDLGAFNSSAHYQRVAEGAIPVDTVLTLDSRSGRVRNAWGRHLFYLPHGITVDRDGNTWVTDVALHQALKFPAGSERPSVVVGRRFEPGNGPHHLCQPTAVAVAPRGEVFVADGYCNSRILVLSPRGHLLRQMPRHQEFLSLQVPHGLALLPGADLVCVADRENMRVVCPRAGLRGPPPPSPPATVQAPDLGRVFGVAAVGGVVYAVNGPTSASLAVRGFTIDPLGETVVDRWGPEQGFSNPHAIAACPNGSAIYVSEIGPNRVWKFDLLTLD